ncbi:MAG: BTAD domain-containing putative transcriptional regulator [bacterium]
MTVTPQTAVFPSDVSAPWGLPAYLTRFIGRAGELREIARMLATTRLLTLTGAGGSGKSRLAREAAACLGAEFASVGWVDLAPITDPTLVAQQVITALRFPDRLSATVVESLVTCIGDGHVLIVLDNCEHLIDSCASLMERLLHECPRLCVLATSREALGISGETAWLVPELAGGDAVLLFVERAQAALPSFTATEGNIAALSEICRRLDGIPLAIELAAARIRVLSPEQIADRLGDAFKLLTTGSRTALPRHRTLRGTMDWSYGLLDDREQRLLRRLSVFAGTFGLAAAEAVCSGAPLDVEDILDGVAALVDKSLVVMESGDAEARYHLLETVRQYGVELLTESRELPEYRVRHAEYFLNFAERITPLLIGGEHEPGLVARVSPDFDNMRAASAWALNEPNRAAEALRFADGLFWYWYCMGFWLKSGQLREGRQYVTAALSRASEVQADQPLLVARALLASGLIAIAEGDNEHARDELTTSLSIAREHGDDVLRAYVLAKLGGTYLMLGNQAKAMELLGEGYELSQHFPPQMVSSFVGFWRGCAAMDSGDLELARAMIDHCVELGRTLQHRTIFAHASTQRGRLMLLEGKPEEAFGHLREAIRVHVDMGDVWGLAIDFDCMVFLIAARGRPFDAVRLMGAVDQLRRRAGMATPSIEHDKREQVIVASKQELGPEFDRAYDEGGALSMEDVVALAYDAGGTQTAEYRAPVFDSEPELVESSGPAMRVLALGALQVFVDNEPIDAAAWGSARSRELLVYLLLHPEGRSKEQVGLAFWPEASTAQVRNNVHVTLHRLRKALRNPDWIFAVNDRYRVDPSIVLEFDVTTFERDVVAARKALARNEDGAVAALERTLSLYRSDLLDGEPVCDWHIPFRDRLQRQFVDALMALGARHTSEGRHAKAADVYRRVLARDDLHEEAALALMRAHTRLGERAQALRYYRRFAERMQRELETEPGGELAHLYEELKERS